MSLALHYKPEDEILQMATRQDRLNEFHQDTPLTGQPVELLCEDHNGTFVLPFPCHWKDGVWHNGKTGAVIEADVLGWRGR